MKMGDFCGVGSFSYKIGVHRSEQKGTYHDVVGSFLLAEMERFELL